MDPRTTLALINEDFSADALQDLADWVLKGGAFPTGEPGEEMHPTISDAAMAEFAKGEFSELAAALRVALAYGDSSGLETFRA